MRRRRHRNDDMGPRCGVGAAEYTINPFSFEFDERNVYFLGSLEKGPVRVEGCFHRLEVGGEWVQYSKASASTNENERAR
jgi:hypothetical protein